MRVEEKLKNLQLENHDSLLASPASGSSELGVFDVENGDEQVDQEDGADEHEESYHNGLRHASPHVVGNPRVRITGLRAVIMTHVHGACVTHQQEPVW